MARTKDDDKTELTRTETTPEVDAEESLTQAGSDAGPTAEADLSPDSIPESSAGAGPSEAPLTAPEHDPRDEAPEEVLAVPEHDPSGDEDSLLDPDEESPMAAGDDVLEAEEPAAAPTASHDAVNPAPARRNTFLPALLGGVVAAGLGFGAAMIAFPPVDSTALEETQDAQQAQLQDLSAQLEDGPDLSQLEDGLSGVQGDLGALQTSLGTLTEQLDGLSARVEELEKQPLAENVSDAAIAAYEDELAALQQAMQDQRAEIEQMVEDSQSLRADAAATARDTQVRAAQVRLNGSLSDGSSFEAPLKTLSELGLEIPAALEANAAAGVPTLARLRNDFPEAARAALSATRDGSLGGSFGDFLKNQLGARSLTPQEGDDPDAILSRAEASLNDGDLGQVLVELDGLPEAALAAMDDWMTLARTRAETLDAAETLSAQTK
ncbi:Uncharacterized conserved protein [Pseudooceanicola antarcticus]|uniref:Uncharacterized conserved protein n=1 Tax=Pseudooceanicola antarcticus TaxID=1247613 RepID=A0A285HWY9_9RHOB|nr:mitofilin family membrane protein [Pseudooceanicola antarcticus]PJE27513.1 hypothetical protein CVM39_13065 [Pseudooceanicola antarcticus]SNY39221.1 Uncharacterized conserved protein [Pseudooceanicola antarcticus]